VKYAEFEKFIGAQMSNKMLCQFSVVDLVDELRNRQDVELTVIEEGNSLATTTNGPMLLLRVSVSNDLEEGMEYKHE
jgi:hypothetical protein